MPTSSRHHHHPSSSSSSSLVLDAGSHDIVHFDGSNWCYRSAGLVLEEEEEDVDNYYYYQEQLRRIKDVKRGENFLGKRRRQVPGNNHARFARPPPCIVVPPLDAVCCQSPSAIEEGTELQKRPQTSRPSFAATVFDTDSPTGHWLVNGRLPTAVSKPKPRHRKTRSLTLSLTTDLESPVRSLTHIAHPEESAYDAMAVVQHQHPPGSPPELTSSKSSKSSSFHSSSQSANDTSTTDLAHFEDIGLDDEAPSQQRHLPQNQQSNVRAAPAFAQNKHNARLNSRRTSGPATTGRNHSPAFPAMRELVTGPVRASPPPLSAPLKPDFPRQSLGPQGYKPTLMSSSTTSLARMAMRNRSRSPTSRSPSPAHMMQGLVSPSAMSIVASPERSSFSSTISLGSRPSARRHSSHTGPRARKTAKELEKEYNDLDNDHDEDLPDEASLWNVPLSPALYRTASSALSSGKSSPTATSTNTSPERPSPRTTPRPHRMIRPPPLAGSRTAPMTSRPFTPRHSDTMPVPVSRGINSGHELPHTPFTKSRAKSWDHVIGEMSEEVKALSEVLDHHDFQSKQSNDVNDSAPGTPELKPLARSHTTPLIELPPIRRNNVMIDPLPVSKEKEAVLSRTRPSWLPPKDRREEKRHLKEYQRMMQASAEAEKRRSAKAALDKCQRDDTAAQLQRIWEEHVLCDFPAALSEPRTRELWWRGIPPACRAEAWKGGIGNDLGLSQTTYSKALERAKAAERKIIASASMTNTTGNAGFAAGAATTALSASSVLHEADWFACIDSDLSQTMPALNLFQQGQALHTALRDVLQAYALYRPDIGYVSGTNLAAAMLVLILPKAADAFTALANLLNRAIPLAFIGGDAAAKQRTFQLVKQTLTAKRPRLAERLFQELGLGCDEVLGSMVGSLFLQGCCDTTLPTSPPASPPSATMFSGTSATPATDLSLSLSLPLSLPLALRLWDILVFDGDRAIVRLAVASLALAEARLYASRDEVLSVLRGDAGLLALGALAGGGGATPAGGAAAGAATGGGAAGAGATATGGATPADRKRDSTAAACVGGVDVAALQWEEDVERVVDVVREVGRAERRRGGGGGGGGGGEKR